MWAILYLAQEKEVFVMLSSEIVKKKGYYATPP